MSTARGTSEEANYNLEKPEWSKYEHFNSWEIFYQCTENVAPKLEDALE